MLVKGATRQMADDSRTGGGCYRTYNPAFSQLLVTVMTFYVNLLPVDHPEMASYEGRFASGIFAILAKALIVANNKMDFYCAHSAVISNLRARSGFLRLHRPFRQKNRARMLNNSYPVIISNGACFSYVHKNPTQSYENILKLQLI